MTDMKQYSDQNFRPPVGRSSSSSGGVKPPPQTLRQIEHWLQQPNCDSLEKEQLTEVIFSQDYKFT